MTHRQRDVENRHGAAGPGGWMGEKLSTQGYRLSDAERRRLWLGLRFPTGLCLALVITALALEVLSP